MAWRTRYGRDYGGSWYDRGEGRDYGPGWQGGTRWTSGDYRRDTGPSGRYGYDYQFRQPPRQSPAYGRGGDRVVRQWARDHGYDAGIRIPPHEADRFAGGRTSFGRSYESPRYGGGGFRRGYGSDFDGYRW